MTTTTPLSLLPGISASSYQTSRLRIHALTRGPLGDTTVVFLHGNASAARFWEETMLALPTHVKAIAPDLRGYGRTEVKDIDATRGLRDFSDDLYALLTETGMGSGKVHLVGWSVGAGVAMQYAIDHPGRVASLTLVAPMSPYGFGGTKDAAGTPCWPDFAGSGGGTAAAEFVQRIGASDTGEESAFSPRKVMNTYYVKPPFRAAPEREDVFVEEILSSSTTPGCYPGDLTTSANWPGIAPGKLGMNNAISPAYCDLSGFAKIDPRPRVLWIRGADDQIVSDTSLFDLGFLGKLGAVPGWPGDEVCPPQPMVGQVRAVLEAYAQAGGQFRELVLADVGHSPHLEAPAAFRAALIDHVAGK
ncbi:MAG: alpha/beta hydrolase [Myxococcales bacterium]|nr:alpha/beta hydrolase [Myxococcales bacterium]HRC54500.1 alpha/beta hydrolase [Kofleriaceae bacterium]